MSLVVPVPTVDIGPDWASNINASLTILDAHTHNPGSGVPITPTGLNINGDLTFLGNNATVLRSVRWTNQLAVLTDPTDLTCAYSSGTDGDLYYNDLNGNNIRMTLNGAPNSGTGNISGLPSTPTGSAGIGWQNGASTFQFLNDAGTSGANIDAASYVFRYPGSYPSPSGNYIILQAPSSLASGYSLTLPALPAQTNVVSLGTTGIISSITYDQVAAGMTATGANAIAATMTSTGTSSIVATATTANANTLIGKSSSANLPGVPTAASKNLVVSHTNNTKALVVMRGTIDSTGAITVGVGFTASKTGTGSYTISFSTNFGDIPAVTTTGIFNAVIARITPAPTVSDFHVDFFNTSGSPLNTDFNFIAIGQAP